MMDIIIDSVMDTVKLIPFLFIAFLIIEFVEHKLNDKSKNIIVKKGKYGPVVGSLMGIVPQCGFSVMATNLYITRIISLGTLISIYLSTSDEMLPLLLSENVDINVIIKILGIKVFIGMISGFVIDLFLRKKHINSEINHNICDDENCHCEHGIILSSIKHTLHILLFILVCNFIITYVIENYGSEFLSSIFMKDNIFSPFITSLIGLIPNCGSSVILTQLFISNSISMSSLIGGLLTGSGVALLVLFRENKNIKENVVILSLIYLIGVISGIVLNIVL